MKDRLYTLLEKFKKEGLSSDDRQKMLKGEAPILLEDIAKAIIGGCFVVKSDNHKVEVHPTCVEIYYHEEDGVKLEAGEDRIQDPIVYHRNPKNGAAKGIFLEAGILHNHVSGIDITFEREDVKDDPKTATRASALIREFQVIGTDGYTNKSVKNFKNPEGRSTALYEALFSMFNIFDGFTIEWEDGEPIVDVVRSVRKNVAQYDDDGNKLPPSGDPAKDTVDHKHLQCQRQWQFRKE